MEVLEEEDDSIVGDDGVPIYSKSGFQKMLDHQSLKQLLLKDPATVQAYLGKNADCKFLFTHTNYFLLDSQLYQELLSHYYEELNNNNNNENNIGRVGYDGK